MKNYKKFETETEFLTHKLSKDLRIPHVSHVILTNVVHYVDKKDIDNELYLVIVNKYRRKPSRPFEHVVTVYDVKFSDLLLEILNNRSANEIERVWKSFSNDDYIFEVGDYDGERITELAIRNRNPEFLLGVATYNINGEIQQISQFICSPRIDELIVEVGTVFKSSGLGFIVQSVRLVQEGSTWSIYIGVKFLPELFEILKNGRILEVENTWDAFSSVYEEEGYFFSELIDLDAHFVARYIPSINITPEGWTSPSFVLEINTWEDDRAVSLLNSDLDIYDFAQLNNPGETISSAIPFTVGLIFILNAGDLPLTNNE